MADCECIPVNLCINPEDLPGGQGLQTWESDWFDIAASGVYNFTHNLALTEPWKCQPRVVAKVKTAQAGWEVDDIVFGDGSNYIGSTASAEIGWAICISQNSALGTFGNTGNYVCNKKDGGTETLSKTSVKCKLLISY